MGPFPGSNPWAQQAHAQAMSCLQAGGQLEAQGNLPAAGPYYHQASQALTGCIQMLGPHAPDTLFYWLSFCQVRLGFLTQASGNAVWAHEWLRQALGNIQAAWQRNPGNPGYQMAAAQLALALGEIQQARQFCQHPGSHPQLAHISQVVQNLTQSAAAPAGGDSGGLAKKVKTWLDVGGKAVDILSTLMNMFGGSGGGAGGHAMPGGFDMGMGGASWGMGGNPFGM